VLLPPLVHVGVGTNTCVAPAERLIRAGEIVTALRMIVVDDPDTVITAELSRTTPFREALTKRPVVPAMLPAVKVTCDPEVALSVPRELEMAHEYEMSGGQVALHAGVAVKSCVRPEATVGAVGLTATEDRTMLAGLTVRDRLLAIE
jgi:hypothetical protein